MAGKSTFGGTVKLTGETEYKKALKDITSNLKLVSSELKLVDTQFLNNDKSIKETKNSYNSMNSTVKEQKEKVSQLREALIKMEAEYGANNDKVKTFKTQLNNAERQLIEMEKATDGSKKELNKFEEAEIKAGNSAITMGDLIKANIISDSIMGGLKSLGSALVNVTKQIGSTLGEIGKASIENYAEYEQLVGGVDTLFKESSQKVQEYANNAYKTAGLSANEYMETVTSFSASLLQSLNGDTAKSAEVADMAITDMSDNANKMGTSMESIQNAYQGFAKQNYTMLD